MNKEEIINCKLNAIYDKLIDIEWYINKIENEKKKQKLKEQEDFTNRELREIESRENEWWNFKEERIKSFREIDNIHQMEKINE